jgi:hypothetical protein
MQQWKFALPFSDFSGRFIESLRMRQSPGWYTRGTALGS